MAARIGPLSLWWKLDAESELMRSLGLVPDGCFPFRGYVCDYVSAALEVDGKVEVAFGRIQFLRMPLGSPLFRSPHFSSVMNGRVGDRWVCGYFCAVPVEVDDDYATPH